MDWFFVWLFSTSFILSFLVPTSAKKGCISTFDYACLLLRDKCQVDAECEFNMICCPSPCGNNCLFPIGELIVIVDVVFLSSISLWGRNWSENFKIVFFTGEFKLVVPKGAVGGILIRSTTFFYFFTFFSCNLRIDCFLYNVFIYLCPQQQVSFAHLWGNTYASGIGINVRWTQNVNIVAGLVVRLIPRPKLWGWALQR